MLGKLYRVINRVVTLLFIAMACFCFWRIKIPRKRSESSIIRFFRTYIKLSRCKFCVFRIRHSLGFSCQSGNTGLVELTYGRLDQLLGWLNLSVSSVRGTLRKFHRVLVINNGWPKCIWLAFRWCCCRIHSWSHNRAIGDQQLRSIVWFLIGLELLKAAWIDLKANLFLHSCVFGGWSACLLR